MAIDLTQHSTIEAQILNLLTWHCQDSIEESNRAIASFKEGLDNDPLNALSWGDSAFEAAANLRVAKFVQAYISREDFSLDQLVAHLAEKTLRGALHPGKSTSASSNLASQYETAAWAKMLDKVKDF